MTTAQPDPQSGFWDVVIDNQRIEALPEAHERSRPGARAYNRTHRDLKKDLDGLESGTRYRIGRFVVTLQPITGGGFEIKKWKSRQFDVRALD